MRTLELSFLVALVVVPPTAHRASTDGPIRVIVNRSVVVETLDLRELNRLYRGDVASLPGGARVVLAEQIGARQRFYAIVLKMTEDSFRRHWIRVVFAGNPVNPPTPFSTSEDLIRFVAKTPGAIGFLEGDADETVRVLRIDNIDAAAPTYPIR
ncbi:MAG: hypothetical protein ABI647_23190 [Gemmatimonadota bacterium]